MFDDGQSVGYGVPAGDRHSERLGAPGSGDGWGVYPNIHSRKRLLTGVDLGIEGPRHALRIDRPVEVTLRGGDADEIVGAEIDLGRHDVGQPELDSVGSIEEVQGLEEGQGGEAPFHQVGSIRHSRRRPTLSINFD